jgi:hypothetical protein
MSSAEVIVTLLGVGAIAWVDWYFLASNQGTASKTKHDHQH